jgi:preprotein translocase subunit SecG
MIWSILTTIFVTISMIGAYITATSKEENVVKRNYISHILYTFSNAYNVIYFFYTMNVLNTQAIYGIRNIIFFVLAIVGANTYRKQIKEKENEFKRNNT